MLCRRIFQQPTIVLLNMIEFYTECIGVYIRR